MPLKENKALVRLGYRILDKKDWAAMRKFASPRIVDHNPLEGQKPGRDGFIESRRYLMDAFSDYKSTIDDIIAEGDKVAVRVTHRFVHTGEFMGFAPRNEKVKYSETTVWRVVNGKVTDRWCTSDSLGMLTQMGAIMKAPSK